LASGKSAEIAVGGPLLDHPGGLPLEWLNGGISMAKENGSECPLRRMLGLSRRDGADNPL
jgi:hypothetical protein